jgi:hypothetical protein
MGKKNIYSTLLAAALLPAISSCDKENNGEVEPPVVTQPFQYVVVATSTDGTYILQADSITSGEISIIGNGIETEAATAWIFYNEKYAYDLVYKQGDPAEVAAYELDENGKLQRRLNTYQMPSRYTTYGYFSDYVVTAVSVTREDNTPGLSFNLLDVNTQKIIETTIPSGNFTGNGETANLSGILEVGDKFFSELVCSSSLPYVLHALSISCPLFHYSKYIGEGCKLLSTSLYDFLRPQIVSSLIDPCILFSTLFSNTLFFLLLLG